MTDLVGFQNGQGGQKPSWDRRRTPSEMECQCFQCARECTCAKSNPNLAAWIQMAREAKHGNRIANLSLTFYLSAVDRRRQDRSPSSARRTRHPSKRTKVQNFVCFRLRKQ